MGPGVILGGIAAVATLLGAVLSSIAGCKVVGFPGIGVGNQCCCPAQQAVISGNAGYTVIYVSPLTSPASQGKNVDVVL